MSIVIPHFTQITECQEKLLQNKDYCSKGWISVRIAECYISERKYQPDEPKGLFSGNRGKRKNQKYSYLKNFFHKRSLILFWPNQLRRLLILDPFEHEVGKESVSFFIIGRAYLVVRRS
jgi:hypothetical protein